jgi:hypothetical protein
MKLSEATDKYLASFHGFEPVEVPELVLIALWDSLWAAREPNEVASEWVSQQIMHCAAKHGITTEEFLSRYE